MAPLHLTADNFDQTIGKGTTLVDFWAGWCGPCRMLAPIIEELANEYSGKVTVAKVDVDAEGSLAMRYSVMSIPTVILFKDGEELDKRIGVHPKEEFEQMINKA